MNKREKELWYMRNSLSDLDTQDEVTGYATLYNFPEIHFMYCQGELGAVVSQGISSYLLLPNKEECCIEIYKKDNLSDKGRNRWKLKQSIYGDDCYVGSLCWIKRGMNI